MLNMFLLMIGAHALADYPLQGDFLSKAKNHLAPIPGVPWYQALAAHAAIQGMFVGIITGSAALGLAEFLAHGLIDNRKCAGVIDFNMDQALHIACKAMWCALVFANP